MSSVYKAVGTENKVNFGWVNESWSLFRANAGLWMAAVVLGVFGPVLFNVFVDLLYRVTNHIAGVGSVGSFMTLPHGLILGLFILTTIYVSFIAGGMANMAVKEVAGKPLVFGDIYSGAPIFGKMLIYGIIFNVLVSVGAGLLIIPGLFLAGLLLPSFALLAGKDGIATAMKRSFAAMRSDRAGAAGLVFVMGMLTIVSAIPFGIGLLATVPMFWLVSALAARDMVRLPALDASADPYFNPLDNTTWRSENASVAPPFGYSQGTESLAPSDGDQVATGPRLSLSGAPLDENGNEIATSSSS